MTDTFLTSGVPAVAPEPVWQQMLTHPPLLIGIILYLLVGNAAVALDDAPGWKGAGLRLMQIVLWAPLGLYCLVLLFIDLHFGSLQRRWDAWLDNEPRWWKTWKSKR